MTGHKGRAQDDPVGNAVARAEAWAAVSRARKRLPADLKQLVRAMNELIDEGVEVSNEAIAQRLGVSVAEVAKRRARLLAFAAKARLSDPR